MYCKFATMSLSFTCSQIAQLLDKVRVEIIGGRLMPCIALPQKSVTFVLGA